MCLGRIRVFFLSTVFGSSFAWSPGFVNDIMDFTVAFSTIIVNSLQKILLDLRKRFMRNARDLTITWMNRDGDSMRVRADFILNSRGRGARLSLGRDAGIKRGAARDPREILLSGGRFPARAGRPEPGLAVVRRMRSPCFLKCVLLVF
jgi:hypothetical protein